jgi:hypothetical protein
MEFTEHHNKDSDNNILSLPSVDPKHAHHVSFDSTQPSPDDVEPIGLASLDELTAPHISQPDIKTSSPPPLQIEPLANTISPIQSTSSLISPPSDALQTPNLPAYSYSFSPGSNRSNRASRNRYSSFGKDLFNFSTRSSGIFRTFTFSPKFLTHDTPDDSALQTGLNSLLSSVVQSPT